MKKFAADLTTDLVEFSGTQDTCASPSTLVEQSLAEVLSDVVHTDQVSVESHFFDDLGADSLVMAQFCARVRKRGDLPAVSMKDIYQHPTIRSLAAALPAVAPLPVAPSPPLQGVLADVLAGVMHTEQVPVDSHFFDDLGADSLVMAQFCARVRKRGDLPSVSMKDIYQHPTISSLATALHAAAPPAATAAPSLEGVLAEVLAGVVHVERVPVDSHFFDDLGADSLVMAQFCARVRKRADLPSVSMKDIYQHPTIRSLATALAAARRADAPSQSSAPAVRRRSRWRGAGQHAASTSLCGALQLLIFLGYSYLAGVGRRPGLRVDLCRLRRGRRLPAVGRCSAARCSSVLCTLPIVAKWVLIGRWKPREIRVWSLGYVRFWVVKTLVRSNPLVCCSSARRCTSLYLRALGAKIGRGVRDPLPERAGVHRPAHHRRRHGDPQGLVLQRLPGPRRA